MARNQDKSGKISFTSPDDHGGGFKRFFVTLFILLVIVMVFVAIGVQTDTGCKELEDYLSKFAGAPVKIDSASIGLPYMLVLDGVASKDFNDEVGTGFRIEEVRIGLSADMAVRVRVNGCRLFMDQGADELWNPAFFARLGNLPLGNVSDITRLTAGFRGKVRLSLKDVSIKWKSVAGVGAFASKVDFEMSRVKMPRQVMYYSYYLKVLHVMGVDGIKLYDIEREWLASETDSYIEIARSEDSGLKSGAGFWEGEGGRGEDK